MAKPTYKILSNNPSEDAYGQYVFNEDQSAFWDITGLSTIETSDDLYSVFDNNIPSNVDTIFSSFSTGEIRLVMPTLKLDFYCTQAFSVSYWRMATGRIYFIDASDPSFADIVNAETAEDISNIVYNNFPEHALGDGGDGLTTNTPNPNNFNYPPCVLHDSQVANDPLEHCGTGGSQWLTADNTATGVQNVSSMGYPIPFYDNDSWTNNDYTFTDNNQNVKLHFEQWYELMYNEYK